MELFRKVHILDEAAKEVVLLRLTGAFSFREIGEIFGKSENWAGPPLPGKAKTCERMIKMKINCEVIKDLLPSYIDGLTSPQSDTLIREHLKECPECREYLEEMTKEMKS